MPDPACEAARPLIEQRLAGALEDDHALEAHLAGCDDCRRYQDQARETAALLAGAAAAGDADWEGLRRRVDATTRAARQSLPRMALALVALVPVIGWAAGREAGIGAVGLGGLILAAAWVAQRRRAAEAAAAGDLTGELLAVHRAELDRRRRYLWITLATELTMGPFLLVLAAVLWRQGSQPPRLTGFQAVWGALLLVSAAWHLTVARPRLRDQRTWLDGVR